MRRCAAILSCVTAGYAGLAIEDWDKVEPHNAAGYAAGRAVNSIDYVEAVQRLQRATRRIVAHWGRDFDLLLTPTMAIEPPEAGVVLEAAHAEAGTPLQVFQMVAYTAIFNFTGQPAVSLPLHWSASGLPIGVQLVARPWGESELVRLGSQLEQAAPWSGRNPRVS